MLFRDDVQLFMVNICYLLEIIVIYRDVVQLFMVNICYLLQIIVIYRDVVQLFMVISVIYCKSLLFIGTLYSYLW